MKKIYMFILGLTVFSSCSSDGGDSETPKTNTAPTIPNLSYPTNNLVCISNVLNFQWIASTDDQKDAISYQIEIATDNSFTQNLNSIIATTTTKQITLAKGKSYYWRVKAIDGKKVASSYSAVYNFYTEADAVVNHVPFAPVLIAPVLNSLQTNSSVDLKWSAVDADATDVLTYDVYFDATNPPTNKVATAIGLNAFTVNTTTTGNYYWKIVVKDGKGGTTVGQVWKFSKQ